MSENYGLIFDFEERSQGLGVWWSLKGTGYSGYLPVGNLHERGPDYASIFLTSFSDNFGGDLPVDVKEVPVHFNLTGVSRRYARPLRDSIEAIYGNDPEVTVSELSSY